MEAVVAFFGRVGLKVSTKPGGLKAPSQCQTWCGWVFDTTTLRVSATEAKWDKALVRTRCVLDADVRGALMARPLAGAGGILNHLAEVDISLRRLLHPL